MTRRKSWWREIVMICGVGVMIICGLLVGREYFNQVMTEIEEGSKDVE
jgi:predicted negative regulator of RcsB-dependent stress response